MVAKSPTKARLERTKKQIESMEDDLAKLSARLNVLRAREQLKQNRERYKMQLKQNAERKQRTHKLIVIGATLIHFFPELEQMDESEAGEFVMKICADHQEHES